MQIAKTDESFRKRKIGCLLIYIYIRPGRQAARSAFLARSALYADGSQRSEWPFSLKIGTHTRHTVHATKCREQPIMYGESGDPAKMTDSKMAFVSRPCSSLQQPANTTHTSTHIVDEERCGMQRHERRHAVGMADVAQRGASGGDGAGAAHLYDVDYQREEEEAPEGDQHARGSNSGHAALVPSAHAYERRQLDSTRHGSQGNAARLSSHESSKRSSRRSSIVELKNKDSSGSSSGNCCRVSERAGRRLAQPPSRQ